jgi:hypothetical protein
MRDQPDIESEGTTQSAMRRPRPRVRFHGIVRTSPLGALLETTVSENADVVESDAVAVASKPWGRVVTDSDLRWWDTEHETGRPMRSLSEAVAEDVDILVDFFGNEQPGAFDGRYWRVVDGSGEAILNPFCFLEACSRKPFLVSIFLIEARPLAVGWTVLAEAHISNRHWYHHLLRRVGAVAAQLVASALRADGTRRGRASEIVPVPRARSNAAVLVGRLRARLARFATIIQETALNDYWAIGILDAPARALMSSQALRADRWIESSVPESYLADPFPWPGRADVVLCERYDYRSCVGVLRALQLTGDTATEEHALDFGVRGLHFSYPCTFQEDRRVFLLPEMAASSSLVLFELLPSYAVRAVCLVESGISAVDPTLFKYEGYYWIAYSDRRLGSHENLCLLYSRQLEGPWVPHALNPVKIDVRSSRSAGTPFSVDGKLYRPAQDCSATYGGALVVNLVRVCTPSSYEEDQVAVLRPDRYGPFPHGVHTMTVQGGRVVFDGKRLFFDAGRFGKRIRAYYYRSVRRRGPKPRCAS